jgi:two-component system response regulator LytT
MINAAVIEDDEEAADVLKACLEKASAEKQKPIQTDFFTSAIAFLNDYKHKYDIVFMDIELPGMNGLDAATKLRQLDADVIIVFVTNMAQYAIQGYKVQALDYVIKPVVYADFSLMLTRAINLIEAKQSSAILFNSEGKEIKVETEDIKYVEIRRHRIVYHCIEKDYPAYGTLKKVEQSLPSNQFYRCNSCYVINLKYVKEIEDLSVIVADEKLEVSHSRRKGLLRSLNDYMGGKPQ